MFHERKDHRFVKLELHNQKMTAKQRVVVINGSSNHEQLLKRFCFIQYTMKVQSGYLQLTYMYSDEADMISMCN